MTDNEIVKGLELHKMTGISSCNECPYKGHMCNIYLIKDALDLIRRQKAEIELKAMDVESLTNERDALEEMVVEQRAEIERLSRPMFMIENPKLSEKEIIENMKKGKIGVLSISESSVRRLDEQGIKSEAIKEFAERLKEKASSSVTSCQGREIYETKQYQMSAVGLDNLVKEMVGD